MKGKQTKFGRDTLRNRLRPCLLAMVAIAAATTCYAAEWPQRFEQVGADDTSVIVLHDGGRAEYSHETKRPDGSHSNFQARNATWEWRTGQCWGATGDARCIRLTVSGLVDGQEVTYVHDYLYEDARLTEVDKAGIQRILGRVPIERK